MNWVNENEERKAKYSDALPLIQKYIDASGELVHSRQYISETLLRGTELMNLAVRMSWFEKNLFEGNDEQVKETISEIKESARNFYKNYNAPTDQKVAKEMFKIFAKNVAKSYQPDIFNTIESKYKNDFSKYIDFVYSKSMFTDSVRLWAFLENPSAKKLAKDPGYIAAKSIYEKYRSLNDELEPMYGDLDKGHRLFVAGIIEKNEGKAMYPDANFTMRLTYGSILDYYPADAVHYNYVTTLKGVMEKEDPDNWEFVVF